MRFVPLALVAAVTVLVVPVLTGYASAPAASALVASSFDADTITTLAANGIEQVAASSAPGGSTELGSDEAGEAARRAFGGNVRAAVLGPFTDHVSAATRRAAWQVLLEDTRLPDGSRGRVWVAIDAGSGDVLAAEPLLELDAG